ncbi:hypothetical protein [Lutibacter sp.]|uniref:hypothetical protein n=1 Tax=Lutibacter sp. TaxID=1925666 RepID=UPI0025BAECAB|nr:hypothetical protein [Lutibacter sp.]MCF6180760.1 hypothetical protein [Lutibacter sp.]
MKKKYYLIIFIFINWFSQSITYAQDEAQDTVEEINFTAEKTDYINFINTYVSHINKSSKDTDFFTDKEIKSINVSKGFKRNIAKKRVIYRNNEIIKVKYIDFLEHNFIKLKSFYYQNNHLVFIRINELLPSKTKKARTYQRTLYYRNNKLLLDSKQKDKKYSSKFLLHLGQEKLQKEYQ